MREDDCEGDRGAQHEKCPGEQDDSGTDPPPHEDSVANSTDEMNQKLNRPYESPAGTNAFSWSRSCVAADSVSLQVNVTES
jgi:hypothetical protein